MGRRKVAALVLVIAIAGYVRCRRHDDDPPPAHATGEVAKAAAAQNPFTLVALAAAAKRVRRIDLKIGETRLEGQAIDDKQQPIGGATITLDGERTTTTEADGSFAFDQLADGDYQIVAEKGNAYGEDTFSLDGSSDPEVITMRVGPTLVFHVVDHTGTPIFGAKLSTSDHIDALTDRDGMVRFRGMELDSCRVDAVAAGYASQHVDVELGDDPKRTIDKRLVLAPSAAIGGIVLDQDGTPVPEATVNVAAAGHTWSDTVDTDAQGHWKLAGFGAGKILASAASGKHVAMPDQVIMLDGQRPRLDLVLHVVLGAVLEGTVVDDSGNPAADIGITAGMGRATSDAKGHFLIEGLAAEMTEVTARGDTKGAAPQAVDLTKTRHAEIRIVVVESSLAGTVKDPHGQGVADARVEASGAKNLFTRTDEFGHFDFGGAPPGDYKLTAARPHDKRSSRAPEGVPAHTGDRHVALVVPDSSSITGRVLLDGKPVEYFGVSVTTTPQFGSSPDAVRSADGRFVQDGLEAGTVTIIVVGPSFQRFTLDGVEIPDGKQLDLGDLAVTAGRSVRGRVVDATGAPVAFATVVAGNGDSIDDNVSLNASAGGSRGTHTDESGRFEIAGMPDDLADWTIQAAEPDHGIALPRPLVATDLDADIQIALQATGSIVGTIANPVPDEYYRVDVTALKDNTSYVSRFTDEEVVIGNLPAGEYEVTLHADTIVPPIHVTVAVNAATPVTFTLPTVTVAVDVELVNDACTGIVVMAPGVRDPMASGTRWLELAKCSDRTHAVIPAIAPGTYQFCNTGCITVEITATPARQHVTITEAPDPNPSPPEPEPEPPAPDGASPAAE